MILSDENKIEPNYRYWYKSERDDRFDGILKTDLNNSVIGEEIRYPRKLFTSKLYLTRIHREMKSEIPIHRIVCLAINVKKGKLNFLIDRRRQTESDKSKSFALRTL